MSLYCHPFLWHEKRIFLDFHLTFNLWLKPQSELVVSVFDPGSSQAISNPPIGIQVSRSRRSHYCYVAVDRGEGHGPTSLQPQHLLGVSLSHQALSPVYPSRRRLICMQGSWRSQGVERPGSCRSRLQESRGEVARQNRRGEKEGDIGRPKRYLERQRAKSDLLWLVFLASFFIPFTTPLSLRRAFPAPY